MKPLIKDMQSNERITTFLALEATELKESRDKRKYLQLTFSDKTGTIRGYLWKNPAGAASLLKQGMFVKVCGTTKLMNGFQIINVDKVRAARKWEISRADFAPSGQLELFSSEREEAIKKEVAA